MIEQECIACGFQVPQTWSPPRHCLHGSLVIDECLSKMLEERTGLRWEEEVYSAVVTQCETGPVRPVDISQSLLVQLFPIIASILCSM